MSATLTIPPVNYFSTRGSGPATFDQVVVEGLAPDGGLYVPGEVPNLPAGWNGWSYSQAVASTLELFGATDVQGLVSDAAGRFHHADVAPIVEVGDRLVFELFWGPTLSFKDHALQVLGRLLARSVEQGTILGATSGDTGSAAIEAVRGTGLRILILFPDGMVSDFQRRQMTTVPDENVVAISVKGTFDDCQAMVKEAFTRHDLLAINSINWARVAAQVGYYVYAGAVIAGPFDVVVPTGNFGNVYSCWMAKQIGVPIETITVANNSNHALADLVNTGSLSEGKVVATTAPSMDIRIPSNLERFSGDPTSEFAAGWSDDREIALTIRKVEEDHGYLLDTHTATAWRAGAATKGDRPQLVVATAHPCKFGDAVTAAVGHPASPPEWYPDLAELPERQLTISPDSSELDRLIR